VTPAPERPDLDICVGQHHRPGCAHAKTRAGRELLTATDDLDWSRGTISVSRELLRDYVRRIEDEAAALGTDAGLDVERLARAIAIVGKNMRLAASADAIAAEYAALARQAETA
jgi:hypothetical protein